MRNKTQIKPKVGVIQNCLELGQFINENEIIRVLCAVLEYHFAFPSWIKM